MSGTWRAAPRLRRARLRRRPRIGCARGPRSWRAIMDAISRLSMAVGRLRQRSACNRADVWRWVQHPTWEDGSMQRKDGLCWLPATELARRMRKRQLTAVEVLEAQLERIERHNPTLNAVVSLDAAGARKLARAADAALKRGGIPGPLHGVPMTLKDAHDVAGLRTTIGAVELDRIAKEDGTVAARLRAAGAIIIGHSNVPPWLADHQAANPIFGRTANPWDTKRTPGGSSGGAAAALAAGMTPLEVGSDLVASIRLPAHFCGVYGLTPTEHRVPPWTGCSGIWSGPSSSASTTTACPSASRSLDRAGPRCASCGSPASWSRRRSCLASSDHRAIEAFSIGSRSHSGLKGCA